MLGAPGLDSETWESTDPNTTIHDRRALHAPPPNAQAGKMESYTAQAHNLSGRATPRQEQDQ